jgi:hypothetical protein
MRSQQSSWPKRNDTEPFSPPWRALLATAAAAGFESPKLKVVMAGVAGRTFNF